jgi:transcriptional regulator with XRE-family HTH domain
MPTDDFPTRLRAERSRLGLTQEQAAELLGVGRGSYRQLEEDRRDPRLSTLVRLVGAGYRIKAIAPELVP